MPQGSEWSSHLHAGYHVAYLWFVRESRVSNACVRAGVVETKPSGFLWIPPPREWIKD